MLYFIDNGIATDLVAVTSDSDQAHEASNNGKRVQTFHDMGCFAEAKAQAYRASNLTGKTYIPTDDGEYVHPRYGVIEAPAIGDFVSYAFNGDSYPCGIICKISDSLRRIETTTRRVFWRRKDSGMWKSNKTWTLVAGHINKRNPSF